MAFVDDEGTPLSAEEATWVLLQGLGGQCRGQPFVYDQKFSDQVPEAARRLGAKPLVERSGHAFLRAKMLESGALFGAEVSGHYFHRDLGGGDDGLYTACRLIALLAESGKRPSEFRRACPPVYLTPDLRLPVEPEEHGGVLERVRSEWSKFPQATLDGVRVTFPNGWALVRSSVTESALTFRFEAENQRGLDRLVGQFCDRLTGLGDELWARYEEATRG